MCDLSFLICLKRLQSKIIIIIDSYLHSQTWSPELYLDSFSVNVPAKNSKIPPESSLTFLSLCKSQHIDILNAEIRRFIWQPVQKDDQSVRNPAVNRPAAPPTCQFVSNSELRRHHLPFFTPAAVRSIDLLGCRKTIVCSTCRRGAKVINNERLCCFRVTYCSPYES